MKSHHAIAYTSSIEPMPEENEIPKGIGDPMLPGIRIVPKSRRTKLDKMSRVDFSRMYTVEHNVKVFDFGTVHRSHLGRLKSQWISTITEGRSPENGLHLLNAMERKKDETKEEKYGDEDDEDEDYELVGVDHAAGGPSRRHGQFIPHGSGAGVPLSVACSS